MVRLLPVVLALLLCGAAQDVTVTLTDGTTVTGELEGYADGAYLLRIGDATVKLEERRVLDIALATVPAPALPPSAAAEASLSAFERGDYETALRKIGVALEEMEQPKRELSELASRMYLARHLTNLLENRDAARLSDLLRRLPHALPRETRRKLFARLAERYAELLIAAPETSFTVAFAHILTQLADKGEIPKAQRAGIADLFAQLGDRATERNSWSSAATLYRAAVDLDPTRAATLKDRRLAAALGAAGEYLARGENMRARDAALEGLELDPLSVEARRLFDDAEFASMRLEVKMAFGLDAEAILRDFLARSSRAEHRDWARKALERLKTAGDPRDPVVAAQMKKYYPLRPYRFALYRRTGGNVLEKIRVAAFRRTGSVLKVDFKVEKTELGWTSDREYSVEIDQDAIYRVAGKERQPLLRFPLSKGDTWTWRSRSRVYYRKVVSLDETVKVGTPEKPLTFKDCVVIEFTSRVPGNEAAGVLTSRSTYAPGAGLVKLEFLEPEQRKYGLTLIEVGVDEVGVK